MNFSLELKRQNAAGSRLPVSIVYERGNAVEMVEVGNPG
jgi:hypothetical protein